MIDHAISRVRALIADKRISLGQVSEITGLPYSTVHEMLQDGWSTRAIDRLRRIETHLPEIERAAEGAPS